MENKQFEKCQLNRSCTETNQPDVGAFQVNLGSIYLAAAGYLDGVKEMFFSESNK